MTLFGSFLCAIKNQLKEKMEHEKNEEEEEEKE